MNTESAEKATTTMKREEVHQVIIIGSGPAGLTAALYAARSNLAPLVFEGDGFEDTAPGGQLMITTEVENFPGMVTWKDGKMHGMMGPDMMDIFRRQAQNFGAQTFRKRVTGVDFTKRPFRVSVDETNYFAETVIVATGASAKWLGIPSEEEYKSYGVSACATCDGAFFKDKDVMVVGGGDTAMEEANYLTRHAKTVTIVHRRAEFRASKIMLERAQKNPKIKWLIDATIIEVFGKTEGMRKFLTGTKIRNTKTGEITEVATDGIFVAIGHEPTTGLFKGVLDMNNVGYLVTDSLTSAMNIPGVFACGDCQDYTYRQAITAAGTGCMAAIDAERFLESDPVEFVG